MAFLPTPAPLLRSTTFTGVSATSSRHVSRTVVSRATVRMTEGSTKEGSTKEESPSIGKAGNSMWKEDMLAGGFPGGEQFLNAWVEDGMTKSVPDLPSTMQSSASYTEPPEKEPGVLGKLDGTEFFTSFLKKNPEAANQEEGTDTPDTPDGSAEVSGPIVSTEDGPDLEAPDESLYAPYFQSSVRFLAPHIEVDYRKNRVGVSMQPVTASANDLYYPKQTKNIAPVINVSYTGALATSSVSLAMLEIDGLPTLPPPARPGEIVTTLVPGSGSGLKLKYEVSGEGEIEL